MGKGKDIEIKQVSKIEMLRHKDVGTVGKDDVDHIHITGKEQEGK